jgi:hypothetical protein
VGSDGDDFGLTTSTPQNGLDVDSGMAHLDSLIFGLSFVTVGTGFDGEPHPLITPHSPTAMTRLWDRRTRRLSSALATVSKDHDVVEVTLYTIGSTATFARAVACGTRSSATSTTSRAFPSCCPEPRPRLA